MQPYFTKLESDLVSLQFLGSFSVKGKIFDSYSSPNIIFLKFGDRGCSYKFLPLGFIVQYSKNIQEVYPEFYIASILHLMNKN